LIENYRINVLNNEFSHHVKLLRVKKIQWKSRVPESMDEDKILDRVMIFLLDRVMIFLNQNLLYSSCWTLE